MTVPAHLSALERQALSAFAEQVRRLFCDRIASIKLFGSRARGTGRCDSDLDIFVSLNGISRADRQKLFDLAFDVGFEYGLTISPLIANKPEWNINAPIARAIEQDGVSL